MLEVKKNMQRERLQAEWEAIKRQKQELKREDDACRIHLLDPERLCPNLSQPRKSFSEESILKLADSIRKYGILQPISVRRICDEETPFGGLYEVIAGERRLRAAKLLNMQYVPCIIIDVDREDSAKLALVENMHREQLNIFEEACAISTLCEKFSLTQEQAASFLCVSQSYIANKIRLLNLTEPERDLIIKNSLTERHARALVRISDPVQRLKVLGYIIEHGLNVQKSEEYIKQLFCHNEQTQEQKPVRKMVIKDIRIFLNSLDRAVNTVKEAGIPIQKSKTETENEIQLIIKIPR
ncbi:MAG: ParB/RepB/Spo0J family partition protein [Clostridia bacterium]|nr:ParB/RepB/Spo0J family partition protein [Clostridia bacterium]